MDTKSFHIVGGSGQMGSWLKSFLESKNLKVSISDEKNPNLEKVRTSDVVFISVPISVSLEVIKETSKVIKDDTLIVDLSSVQEANTNFLESLKNPAVQLHFLFGPSIISLQDQKIIVNKIDKNKKSEYLINLLEESGADIIGLSAKEHDNYMAHVQGLTHFINLCLAKVLIDDKIGLSSKISTPIFLSQLSTLSRVISQNPELITEIQILNPLVLNSIKKFIKAAESFENLIESKDIKKLIKEYQLIGNHLESKSGKAQSIQKFPVNGNFKLPKEKLKIGYLGPVGTFSHQISKEFSKDSNYELISKNSFYDIFDAVSSGSLDLGLVPAQNSIEGTIRETLDLLVEFDLKINLALSLKVNQNLLSKEKRLDRITKVISHPQALGQCRKYLKENLSRVKIETSQSTISGIDRLEEKGTAIIGSEFAAKIYVLNILAENIEDQEDNITKFYVISKNPQSFTNNPTKSLLFVSIFNRVGILRDILNVFADLGVNLNNIESRPSKEKTWDYNFFIEIESSEKVDKFNQAINLLKQYCPVIKVLGQF